MQDNFTQDSTIEQLIKLLDGELTGNEKAAAELLLQNNDAVKTVTKTWLPQEML